MREICKVLSALFFPPERIEEVRGIFPGSDFVHVDYRDTEAVMRELPGADVALLPADVDARFLGENDLKWVHCDHAGLNQSASQEILNRGWILTGASGRSAPVLAEHCVYFMLQSCYHTRELLRAQEACRWGVEGQETWRGLYGRTAGIIGMGNNGKMLAERLLAFGMDLITYDRNDTGVPKGVRKQLVSSRGDTIDPLLEQADFIILCVGLNDSTYHMLDEAAFGKMKEGVTIVNMGRGPLIDTPALIRALEAKKVGCAGLDVTEPEPLSSDSPLWGMDQVYITPHVTPQVPDRTGRSIEIIRENARRYRAEEPLLNQVRREDLFQKR